ncbi:DNA polymerase I [Fervidobacterium changbaicum]|uniref:DNA polymerase I n=1 Tax=Fervidobacterium changbaicum TaxID=310769 RepID=A0ABX5QPK4_9BACT|nr:DNA polymerase I [Fervidobacterium changbaicum]QAV32390.1 DNA polymerase I [Fervidobacterium changbaicum]SDH17844.1 DNA polymerase I [Fervidobacterium changbaicum]
MAKAFLFDGTGLLYRAFYAIDQSLSTTTGIPTGALYGLARMLLKFIKEHIKVGEDYCAFVVDVKGGSTYRKELYEKYKAHRPETPEPLLKQIGIVGELVDGFGIKLLRIPGYEADDVIATLSKRFEKEKDTLGISEINVVTSDKDLLQLVNENISVWRIEKGVTDIRKYTVRDVFERYGVYPHQIIDYLALVGDASDNIPGVPGIGEKTAVKLLQDFGSVENALRNQSRIPEKVREKLLSYLEDYELSKKLVELNCEIDIPIDLKELKYQGFKPAELLEVLKKFEFASIIKELQLSSSLEKTMEYRVISKESEFKRLLEEIERAKKIAIDLETSSLDPFSGKIVGVSIAVDEGRAYYIPVAHLDGPNASIDTVKKFLKDTVSTTKFGGHNLKFDIKFLRRLGIEPEYPTFDTMIEAYLLNPNEKRFNLDEMALKFLGYKMMSYEEVMQGALPLFAGDFSYVPVERAARYSCEDADMSLRIHNKLYPVIYSNEMVELYEKIELPLVSVLAQMELNGVFFDTQYLSALSVEMERKLSSLSQRIYEIAGEPFNLNSPKQVGYILFEKLKLPVMKSTNTGAYSTDVEVLENLAPDFEIARLLLEYRKIQKLKSTYVDAIPTMVNKYTGRVHASFNQTGTATGRLSSSDPNLQNLPGRTDEGREIRMAVKPQKENWWILGADYSQIELRVLAHMSEDEELIKAFSDNRDIHLETAKKIFGVSDEFVNESMRRIGKMVNFAIVYGVSPYGLSRRIGLDVKETRRIIDAYFNTYKGVQSYIATMKEFARKNGYVKTMFGRRREVPQINAKDPNIRAEGERIAINTPIQGTAADIMKIAMIRIHERLKKANLKSMMILQVHDELVFEVPDDELEMMKDIVKTEMENAVKLRVPLMVDVYVEKYML